MTRHYGAEATNALLPGKASGIQVTSNRTPKLTQVVRYRIPRRLRELG